MESHTYCMLCNIVLISWNLWNVCQINFQPIDRVFENVFYKVDLQPFKSYLESQNSFTILAKKMLCNNYFFVLQQKEPNYRFLFCLISANNNARLPSSQFLDKQSWINNRVFLIIFAEKQFLNGFKKCLV